MAELGSKNARYSPYGRLLIVCFALFRGRGYQGFFIWLEVGEGGQASPALFTAANARARGHASAAGSPPTRVESECPEVLRR